MEPDGKIVRRVSLGPSNYQNIGADAARNVLRDGLSQVTEEARGELLGACLGLAGLDTAQDERIYSAMVGDLFGDAAISEERRVGEESRARGWPHHLTIE